MKWFRSPDRNVVSKLPYLFWLREGYTNLFLNVKTHLKEDSMWDLRTWTYLLVFCFWMITLPVVAPTIRSKKLIGIDKGDGLSISNLKNIKILEDANV